MKKLKSLLKLETITNTTVKCEVKIGDAALRLVLNEYGYAVPSSASITFRVPGGGDWSNTDVDVTTDNPITVSWVEHK